MADTIPVAQLRAFVERIERIEADIKDLNGDKSEVYKELRGCGFDVKAVRAVVAKRKLDTADREERDAMFDLYWSALNGEDRARAHAREIIEEFDPETGEIHDADSGQYVGRTDDEQRDEARVPGAVGRGKGDNEGAQGQGNGVAGTHRSGRPVAGIVDSEDEDGRGRHVGGEARHEVVAQDDVGATASSTNSNQREVMSHAAVEAATETASRSLVSTDQSHSAASSSRQSEAAGDDDLLPVVASTLSNPSLPTPVPLGSATSERGADVAAASPSYSDDEPFQPPAFLERDYSDPGPIPSWMDRRAGREAVEA